MLLGASYPRDLVVHDAQGRRSGAGQELWGFPRKHPQNVLLRDYFRERTLPAIGSSSSKGGVLPSDLLASVEFTIGVLRPFTDRDWSVGAGSLEWDVAFTVAHVAACMTKYAVYLAAATTKWSPLVVSGDPRASNDQLLDAVEITAGGLSFVASSVDSATRGYHAWGMGDGSAFLARAANEVLVHGWDAASGLGVTFQPSESLCAPIVAQRLPWVGMVADSWDTLLTANGRTGDENWPMYEGPIEEWDGIAPSGPGRPPAIAWQWDAGAQRWEPTYP